MASIITVTHAAGGTIKLGTSHPKVDIVSATQSMALMEEDKVDITVDSSVVINFAIGDWINVYNRRYTLNSLPKVTKRSIRDYTYELSFEGPVYELQKVIFKLYKLNWVDTPEFTLMGNLSSHWCGSLANAGNDLGNFSWSSFNATGSSTNKTLSFSNETALEVLNKIADEYGCEYQVLNNGSNVSYNIQFTSKAGSNLAGTDIFYLGRGIRTISRSVDTSQPFCTRLYVMGSDKNLPSNYRNYSTRLLPTGSLSYIENATAKANWGLVEAAKIWEDIFPTRTGTISSLGADEKTFIDSSMDFDLNATSGGSTLYLIPGNSAKIHFQTGKLAGYEFTLKSYTHSTKTFIITPTTDERGLITPNPTLTEFKMAVGDTYKIVDIWMPSSYVTTAEATLLSTATTWLNANCNPMVTYDLEMDEYWIGNNKHGRADESLYAVGDVIHITDAALGIDSDLRILGFKRDVLKPYRYTFTLGNAPYRKPTYKVVRQMKQATFYIKNAGIDDPGYVRLKGLGDNYSLNQATGLS